MFEKELQTYLKAASSALPCAEARAAFEGYVHCVALKCALLPLVQVL